MKVSAVFNINPNSSLPLNETKTIEKRQSNPQHIGFASQEILSQYAKTSLIKFTGTKIDNSYFRLPKGATPDEYQIEAAKNLHEGKSVLVSAPTGTGKTAIAQYIISKNLEEGKKTFYTTPLKALSNQKLLEFRKIYGDENVGILTGDRKENSNAPILIMTTEVYRNMAFEKFFNNKQNLSSDVKTIIFDEFHYLGDKDRGASWEESVIFSPKNTQILGLSATIGNDEQMSKWLEKISDKNIKLVHVDSSKRHVPLKFFGYSPSKNILFKLNPDELVGIDERKKTDKKRTSLKRKTKHCEQKLPYNDDYISLVNRLSKEDKLPAIVFVFNKKFSRNLLDSFANRGKDLTTDDEKAEIQTILNEYEKKYDYIGEDINKDALLKGYAIHNAGILPVQKELIEELFNKKLLKTVIATETLAAGINMPARTVVISSCDKPTSDPKAINGRRNLTANEFHQMAGRAGRRGIDQVGYVVTMCVNPTVESTFKSLVGSEPNAIYSAFDPNYSLIANYHKYSKNSSRIREIFANSFKIFTAGEGNNEKKINAMYNRYEAKSNLLAKEGFLVIGNNKEKTLTPKGYLIPNIIGYPQVPLINLITSHALEGASPEDLVFMAASIVGGQYHAKPKSEDQLFEYDLLPSSVVKADLHNVSKYLDSYLDDVKFAYIDNISKKYDNYNSRYISNIANCKIDDEIPQPTNIQVGSLIHAFAYLNSINPDESVKNWQLLTRSFSPDCVIRDEGSYYNMINQTIDLLSQMIDLSKDTKNVYEYKNDQMYYEALTSKLKRAIKLLKQDPIQNYLYESTAE